MIPKSFIQDLLNRLDIVDVVERYVPLKKAGANFVACCPFHSEKSPSFTVSQSKQFYHCFGCGAHGTAISFVMEHAGLGYVDAIEELARSAGLEVPHERGNAGEVHHKIAPDLYEVMQSASRYYREQLKLSRRAIDYLKQRGLSGEIAARFGIGYAPDGWQNLASAFQNYNDASLNETGLVIKSEQEKRYDRFRDRIMFPIFNMRGQVIGFGGRILDRGEPKYLNSPETPLFEKGRELYGLFQAQKVIRERKLVLVVEGYMDVVALAQHGVEYAVATLGTSTTPYHVQKLLRLSEHIVFCFDGDKAGQRAAWRALENVLPYLQDGKRISFMFLQSEHDPDSYINEYGKDAFENLVQDALPLSAYLLREISTGLDLRTQEGKNQLLQRAKPLVTTIIAPVTGLLLRKEVAALSGISQAELEALYEINPVVRETHPNLKKVGRSTPSSHRLLLQCLLAQPELGSQFLVENQDQETAIGIRLIDSTVLLIDPSVGAEAGAVAAVLNVLHEADFALSTPALMQMFLGTVHGKILAAAEAEMLSWGENFDVGAEFSGLMNKFEEGQRRQQFQELQAKLVQGGLSSMTESERDQYRQLLQRS